ncbi:hypothetical protein WDZ92_53935, partial [Nostoc sp. NIES-2111]
MALRGLAGRPLRSLFSVLGLAMAVPMIVLGLFWWDALGFMIAVQFEGVDRADAVVSFTDPVAGRAAREIAAIPGVLAAQGQKVPPVPLRAGTAQARPGLHRPPARTPHPRPPAARPRPGSPPQSRLPTHPRPARPAPR